MKLLIATNNAHKLTEIRAILGNSFDEILSLKDVGLDVDVEETGTTLYENAMLKASTIAKLSGLPSLGDDTGLMVDALDGAPGVYSARYAGNQHNDADNVALLLKNLLGKQGKERAAHFCTEVVLFYPDGHFLNAQGRTDGEIATECSGNNGFGYDPIFYSYDLKKIFATATPEEKNSVSHRGRAVRNLLALLNEQ